MQKLSPGIIESLSVARKIETGYVLTNGKEEVLLHVRETETDLDTDQEVEAFLYQDKKGQLVATTYLPDIHRNTYGWAEVVETVEGLGVFVNIGIQKEILVSKDDLPLLEGVWPQQGDQLFVTLVVDKKGRLLAKPVTEEIIEQERDRAQNHLKGTVIGGRVYRSTKVGSFIISEEGYRGFIHHTERKEEPRLGEWVEGRVIEVKEDGTINVSLRPVKQEGIGEDADEILNYLKDHGHEMPFTDKSDSEEIKRTFKISKAAFKRALGKLMKEGKVVQQDGKTFLKEK